MALLDIPPDEGAEGGGEVGMIWVFEWLLLIVAALVTATLAKKANPWPMILAYWAIVTARNIIGLIVG